MHFCFFKQKTAYEMRMSDWSSDVCSADLELLVKRKRLAKNAPVPCIVKNAHDPISEEEDSLAENTHREQLHPLDQFRGMKRLIDQGDDIETIAATFMTTPAVVRQRLTLASVPPALRAISPAARLTPPQPLASPVH